MLAIEDLMRRHLELTLMRTDFSCDLLCQREQQLSGPSLIADGT